MFRNVRNNSNYSTLFELSHGCALFIVFAAAIIEIATIGVFYGSKNAKVIYGKNIKEMSYFNMIAIWCVPLLIGFVNTSLYTSKIDLENFKKIIEIEGIIKAFFEYTNICVMLYFKQ